jgi:hypothetical protein
MQERLYEVPSIMYQVGSEVRAEIQETRLYSWCYEIRMIHEFQLQHSSIGVQRSTLNKYQVTSIK